jgi:transposase
MRHDAAGYGRRTGWRSSTQRSTPSCARAAGPSSTCRAPATPKKSQALPDFQARGRARLQRALPPENRRPVRVFSQDDSRCGVLTVRRRRLTAGGVQPVGAVQHGFEWFYGDGAVAPTTGERFFLELPYLKAAMGQLFIDALAQAVPGSLNLLLLDHSGAHTAQRLRWPEKVRYVWWPPYGPELSPSARVWRDVKDDVAWRQCPDLDAQQHAVGDLFCAYEATTLQSLTG